MYETYYFLHIAGVALWIGAFTAFGFLLRSIVKAKDADQYLPAVLVRIKRFINWGVLPSAFIVMVTGIMMIIQFDHSSLPFYLIFMERVGGMAILVTIVWLSLFGRKLQKKLQGKSLKRDKSLVNLSRSYSYYLYSSSFLAVVVVIVVSMRIM